MKTIITQLMTGRDNITFDIVRVLAVASIAVGLGLAIFAVVWRSQVFSLQDFGIGIGAVFLSVGGALKLKADTEPTESAFVATSTTTVTEKAP